MDRASALCGQAARRLCSLAAASPPYTYAGDTIPCEVTNIDEKASR